MTPPPVRGSAVEEIPVEIREVSRTYVTSAERVEAVRGVSLRVRAGEFVALMGPSGCGKSTLLGLMSGLQTPDSGEVLVSGVRIDGMSAGERAGVRLRSIGTVFQDHNLVPEFTALENVMLPMELRGIPTAEAAEQARDMLVTVGLEQELKRYPANLSGGQRQRVGIARAIAGGRRLLLADESTGSLDHKNSRAIFAMFRALADSGYGVLAATHDPTVTAFSHRTVEMIDGALLGVPAGR